MGLVIIFAIFVPNAFEMASGVIKPVRKIVGTGVSNCAQHHVSFHHQQSRQFFYLGLITWSIEVTSCPIGLRMVLLMAY